MKKKYLKGFTIDELMEKSYGKKGTKKRKDAEKRIKEISKKLK